MPREEIKMLFSNAHNHSTFSDGIYTPEEIAVMAKALGYRAVVLTDHDTVQGTYFMQKAARKVGLMTLLGCEFTTVEWGEGFHLLGFDFNPDEPGIRKLLEHGAKKHRLRAQLLLKWAQEKGRCTGITWQEVCEEYPYNDFIANNHIFNLLVKKGIMKPEEYFSFFDPDFKWTEESEQRIMAEIRMYEPSTKDVIKAIIQAGGVPVLAHPHDQLQYIPGLIEAGLMGVEANHPSLTDEEIRKLHFLADEKGLYKTGGTDHSGALGGYDEMNPALACELGRNSQSEKDFMDLYERKLG